MRSLARLDDVSPPSTSHFTCGLVDRRLVHLPIQFSSSTISSITSVPLFQQLRTVIERTGQHADQKAIQLGSYQKETEIIPQQKTTVCLWSQLIDEAIDNVIAWGAQQLQQQWHKLKGHKIQRKSMKVSNGTSVRCMHFHPTRPHLNLLTHDDQIRAYDIEKKIMLTQTLTHEELTDANTFEFSPNGTCCAVGGRSLGLWFSEKIAKGQALYGSALIIVKKADSPITCIGFSPCSRYLLSVTAGGEHITVYDVAYANRGDQYSITFAHTLSEKIEHAEWSKDGQNIFLRTFSGKIAAIEALSWHLHHFSWSADQFAVDPRHDTMLIVSNTEMLVRCFSIAQSALPLDAMPVISLSFLNAASPTSEKFEVDKLAFSASGKWLALSFRSSPQEFVSLVAVFEVIDDLIPSFRHCGFIRSELQTVRPVLLAWQSEQRASLPNASRALDTQLPGIDRLAIVWGNGTLNSYGHLRFYCFEIPE